MKLVKLIFPNLYDIKYICKQASIQESGLANVAEQYGVKRRGDAHQAGSDSLLTGQTFFKLKEKLEENSKLDVSSFKDVIYGIWVGWVNIFGNYVKYESFLRKFSVWVKYLTVRRVAVNSKKIIFLFSFHFSPKNHVFSET